ncbi:MAG: flagellar basal body-associated FliL family protein [Synergistaceae bacterium]|jgi:flagellar FliL protein|nr:flagellar basal body-associated FliL family protein [Synergistaceae bacterium]
MALGKKSIIMIAVAVVILLVGVGGGIYAGLTLLAPAPVETETRIPDPGPMIELGQFTSTLADAQVRVLKLKVTVELAGPRVMERLADPGWLIMLKDEVIKTLKDQRYDTVRYAEGMERLKQDMRDRFNAILPRVEGDLAVRRVLFDEYMAQ